MLNKSPRKGDTPESQISMPALSGLDDGAGTSMDTGEGGQIDRALRSAVSRTA